MTIIQQLEAIAGEICDNYCKWPELYDDMDELCSEHCDECPLTQKL